MRINAFIAATTGMGRRAVDTLILANRILVNDRPAMLGQMVSEVDKIIIDGKTLNIAEATHQHSTRTIMLNKPKGYVVSRNGQGNKTIYELLPKGYYALKPIGRLDKDSSGLLLLTNDGKLAHQLTHPKFQKEKVYDLELDKTLTSDDKTKIEQGIQIDNYISHLQLAKRPKTASNAWQVTMSMGRNRQIRRTFAALDYSVVKLHRIKFGGYKLSDLPSATFREV